MDLVQAFKVDLVHREGISAMRSRLGCTAIPKSRGQRWAPAPLAAKKTDCRGRNRPPAPLAARKTGYLHCQVDKVGFQGVYQVHP